MQLGSPPRVFALTVSAVALCAAILMAPPSWAHGSYSARTADSDCTWESNTGNWFNLTLYYADRYATPPEAGVAIRDWPPDAVREGSVYSFQDRMDAAVASLDGQLNTATEADIRLYNGGPGWSGNVDNYTHIIVAYYEDRTNPAIYEAAHAVKVVSPRSGGNTNCEMGDAVVTNSRIVRGWIVMPEYTHWHTSPVRGEWENCVARTDPGANYLCSKDWDFESSFKHEVGHTLGFEHPGTAGEIQDGHCEAPTRTVTGGTPTTRVTDPGFACPADGGAGGHYRFTTARRSLFHGHDYDVDGIVRQFRDQL